MTTIKPKLRYYPVGVNSELGIEHCGHCKMLVVLANPSGFCNHVKYPENCAVCSAAYPKGMLDDIISDLEFDESKEKIEQRQNEHYFEEREPNLSACMNKPEDSDMHVSSTIEDWMEQEACNHPGCQSKQCKEFKLILMREANALYKELNNDKVEFKKLKDLLARSVTTLQVRTCLCCNPFDEDWLKLRDEITEYLGVD